VFSVLLGSKNVMYVWLVYFMFPANYLIIMILALWLFIIYESFGLYHCLDFHLGVLNVPQTEMVVC
jgi:hypothetical protein